MELDYKAVAESIKEYLEASGEAEIDPAKPLNEQGVDSFSLIEILLFLEGRYKHLLPARLLSSENTGSLEKLAKTYAAFVKDKEG